MNLTWGVFKAYAVALPDGTVQGLTVSDGRSDWSRRIDNWFPWYLSESVYIGLLLDRK